MGARAVAAGTAAAAVAVLLVILGCGLLASAGDKASFAVAGLALLFVTGNTFACRWRSDFYETEDTEWTALRPGPAAAASAREPVRRPWLDRLRTVLVVLVVVGHAGVAYLGVGWIYTIGWYPSWYRPAAVAVFCVTKAWLVPMLYFVSGFLAPPALDRRGPHGYVRRLWWRLCPLFLVFWFGIGPSEMMVSRRFLTTPERAADYFPSDPVTWYLLWLLVFHNVHALMPETPQRTAVPRPTLGQLLKWVLPVAALQLAASACTLFGGAGALGLGTMPMGSPGDGLYNAMWFAGGVVACRNRWLDDPWPYETVNRARGLALVLAGVAIAASFVFLAPEPVVELGSNSGTVLAFFLFVAQAPMGLLAVGASVAILDASTRHGGGTRLSAGMTLLARGAMGAYLLHPWLVMALTFAYVRLLESWYPALTVTWDDPDTGSTTRLPSDGLLFAGFAFTAVTAVPASFLVGNLLKSVPGLNLVL